MNIQNTLTNRMHTGLGGETLAAVGAAIEEVNDENEAAATGAAVPKPDENEAAPTGVVLPKPPLGSEVLGVPKPANALVLSVDAFSPKEVAGLTCEGTAEKELSAAFTAEKELSAAFTAEKELSEVFTAEREFS